MNKCWPNLYDLVYRLNGLVSKESCDYFISSFEHHIKLALPESSLKYGGEYHGKVVEDDFASLSLHNYLDNKEIKAVYDLACVYLETALLNYVSHLQRNVCSTILKSYYAYPTAVRILRYQKGNKILDHSDAPSEGEPVYASCTLNLNNDYVGGEFSFFNGKHLESFSTGDAMVFPASPMWIHGTQPIISGTRYCINAFISPSL
tara:strand:- start:519 stop:1130 length:612 start_codon:yes stop_codon:yes gene_type:complete